MFIIKRVIIGEVTPHPKGRVPWQSLALRAVADNIEESGDSTGSYEGIWEDGTRFSVSIEKDDTQEEESQVAYPVE